MISLEKGIILTPSQKLLSNVGDLGKIIVATGFEWLAKVQKSPNLVTLHETLDVILFYGLNLLVHEYKDPEQCDQTKIAKCL